MWNEGMDSRTRRNKEVRFAHLTSHYDVVAEVAGDVLVM